MKKKIKAYILVIGFSFLFIQGSYAQSNNLKLADEYFKNEEYSKAKDIYDKLAKNKTNQAEIYVNYLATLKKLNEQEEAQKFLKKVISNNKENLIFKIDLGLLYKDGKKKEEADKYFRKLFDEIKKNPVEVDQIVNYLLSKQEAELAENVLLKAREAGTGRYNYELANIYRMQNKKQAMLGEILETVDGALMQPDMVKNMLQSYLNEPEDFEVLDKELLTRVQAKPDNLLYSELLIWSNLQQKNFYAAFIQSKAIDRRTNNGGMKSLEVGMIAFSNKDYESSQEIFEYIVNTFPSSPNYIMSKMYMIKSKEEVIKNTFPVDNEAIKSLVNDYRSFIDENRNNQQAITTSRNLALLYAFYLNKSDSAIAILNNAIATPRTDPKFVAQCKLDLGDIYLFRSEPWEATLLYSQVEKAEKDQPLGHEAKLKNAKLNYYNGDFELAQEHLNVLKLATSREIANDALGLSLSIQDNIGLDSTTEAMEEYAKTDLLLYQNKFEEATAMLDGILKKWPGHSLTDEVYMSKAAIAEKKGNFELALANLEEVIKNYKYDVNGDKAHFKAAVILEENLDNKEKAMELYQKLMVEYPASIFTVEARKRFRQLRGDTLN